MVAHVGAIAIARKRKQALDAARERERRLNQKKVDAWFQTFDKNQSGLLEREQLKELLLHLNPSSPPDDKALDLMMLKATAIDTTGDGKKDTKGISRASVHQVVKKYSDYSNEQKVLDAVFDEFDTNKSGVLEPDQVRGLLQKVVPSHPVTDGDVDYILDQCDKEKAGSIAREEALAACATWKKMVANGATESSKSGCCVVM